MVLDCVFRCFSDIERNSTNKCKYASPFIVAKHREPQSSNTKLFLPIIPIGIIAYAFTPLWDNFCRNRKMCVYDFIQELSSIRKRTSERSEFSDMAPYFLIFFSLSTTVHVIVMSEIQIKIICKT